jgi:hypothetical protein
MLLGCLSFAANAFMLSNESSRYRMTPVANARRDLFEAMKQIAETGQGPQEQLPSMGCSIKWKD